MEYSIKPKRLGERGNNPLPSKEDNWIIRNEMFEELGISFGTALIVLLALYFIIKWAVKNGIKEAYRDITGKVTTEDIEAEQICNEEEK